MSAKLPADTELAKIRRLIELGELPQAKKHLHRLLSKDPSHVEANELAGDLSARAGNFGHASKYFRAGRPSSGLAIKLASALVRQDQFNSAASVLQDAVQSFPKSVELRIEFADLLASFGEWEIAFQNLTSIRPIPLENALLVEMSVQCLMNLNRVDEAQALLVESIAAWPHAKSLTSLGYLLQAQGRFGEARENFLHAIRQNPGWGAAYHGLGQGKPLEGEELAVLEAAYRVLSDGSVLTTDEMAIRYFIGSVEERLGDFVKASVTYDRANDLALQINLGGKVLDKRALSESTDRTIRRFGRDLAGSGSVPPGDPPFPIFVVGMMRSGTTLLEQILSSHPLIAGGGEIPFWTDRREESFDDTNLPKLRSEYRELLHQIASNARWVIDKLPDNYRNLGAIHRAFPDAPILHIRRDPSDTCLSIYTTAYSVSPDFAHERESIAFAYREYLRLMAHWREVIPVNRLLEIHYEDLLANPEEVVRGLLIGCGIVWNDAVLHHESNRRLVTTPSVWQVRQRLYAGSIGRFQRFAPFFPEFSPRSFL